MDPAPAASFLSRHQFLILRLHSLSGFVPVGAYMVVHLITNASVLAGAGTFQDNVDTIHKLGPFLPAVEWTFIFLPILFHAIVGVIIIRTGISNVGTYAYRENFRYTLQRVTAWIALFFIFYHVFEMHGWFHNEWWRNNIVAPLGGGRFQAEAATSTAGEALRSVTGMMIYTIGVLSCVYHFANGLWTMGITWGLWTTEPAQRRANWLALGVGLFLTVVSIGALVGFGTTDLEYARAIEKARIEQHEQELQRVEQIKTQSKSGENTPTAATH